MVLRLKKKKKRQTNSKRKTKSHSIKDSFRIQVYVEFRLHRPHPLSVCSTTALRLLQVGFGAEWR